MKTTVTFEIDTDSLTSYTDEYIAQLWHIAQANPAPFGDREACRAAEHIGREIIRRWLTATPPALWSRNGEHIAFEQQLSAKTEREAAESARQSRIPYTTTFIGTTNAADMQTSAPPAFPEGTTPIFLTGAQGCGKTINAPAIAAALGCSEIIDGLDAIPPLAPGSKPLVISEPPTPLPKGAVVVQIADAEGIATLISGGVPGLSEASAKWRQEFAELRRLNQAESFHTLRTTPSSSQSDPASHSDQIVQKAPAETSAPGEAPAQDRQTSEQRSQ